MKFKLAFIQWELVCTSIYASGSEGWVSDDESGIPPSAAYAATAAPDFSGLCDDEFPGESIEIYYEKDDKGLVTSVIISCSTAQLEQHKQPLGLVKFRAFIGNISNVSTTIQIESSIKGLLTTQREWA